MTPFQSSLMGRVAAELAASLAVVPRYTIGTTFPIPQAQVHSRPAVDDSLSPLPDAAVIFPPLAPPEPELGPELRVATAASNRRKHVLQLIRTRLRPGNRRHPFRLANVVRVTYDISRINRIRTRLTNPTDLRICMTLPDAASIHHVSYRSLGWYTVQVPPQLTTAMTSYKAIAD